MSFWGIPRHLCNHTPPALPSHTAALALVAGFLPLWVTAFECKSWRLSLAVIMTYYIEWCRVCALSGCLVWRRGDMRGSRAPT